ncbi:hypothetical protein PORY_002777 [Pneumocystis oryctolagi]|uniref:Uncharacterized protein n=1 Tax=Pneumocystis oryctolagi TaxID=42067 RepID=A0ACB7CFV1_9ASCO|nr:hypothetical protein PORY_002777 [Pneumocystis oryctolagi]
MTETLFVNPLESSSSNLNSNFLMNTSASTFQHSEFNPYQDNGGLSVAISGEDYVILAGDTRQVKDYNINSRYQPRVFDIGDNLVVSTCGFSGDSNEVMRILKKQLILYHHKHNRQLRVKSAARLIQTILYSRRFFPYYVYVMVAGIDEEGKGAIYTFDPVGSYERVPYQATGGSASLALPLLDSQNCFINDLILRYWGVGRKNQYENVNGHLQRCSPSVLTFDQAMKMVKDVYTSVTERHIQIGDRACIFTVTSNGICIEEYPLRRD